MAKICGLTLLFPLSVLISAPTLDPLPPKIELNSKLPKDDDFTDLRHVVFLVSRGEMLEAVKKYLDIYEKTGEHNYEVLRQLSTIILESGLETQSVEKQLLSLFGVSLANDSSFIHFLEYALKSRHPLVQAAALHLIASLHEDVADSLIETGMKSDYLMIRFEALSLLIARKSKTALGQAEALMNLLHPRCKPLFMEFYASYGSPDAIAFLKQMTSDSDDLVRKAAILSAAKFGLEDLLPNIRKAITHSDPALKECASTAAGFLRDLNSVENLKIAATSPFEETKLAALFALYQLGDTSLEKEILELAEKKNLFALHLLGAVNGGESLLEKLVSDENDEVRLNAALALLKKRSKACSAVVRDILIADENQISFVPVVSSGNSLVCWKIVSTASAANSEERKNLQAITMNFQEEVLTQIIDLPENAFVTIASCLLREKKNSLVPTLMRLMENTSSDRARSLLREHSQAPGAPLVRAYCNLALYRLDDSADQKRNFLSWLSTQKPDQLIEFRPMMERGARQDKNISNFQLTPEERSGFLIESYFAISEKHEQDGVTLILQAMKDGHPNNCYPLAGLLLKSIL